MRAKIQNNNELYSYFLKKYISLLANHHYKFDNKNQNQKQK